MTRWFFVVAAVAACGVGGGPTPGGRGDDETGPGAAAGPTTWYRDVAPLLAEHCGRCHREGGAAPFAVDDPEVVRAWAPAIADAVATGRMPPFDAAETVDCPEHLPFAGDPRLSDDEKSVIAAWVDAGAPEGDPADARELVLPVPDALVAPDAVVTLAAPFEVSGTDDVYACFRVPLPTDRDVYVTGIEVLPDNDRVVHHVLVWSDPDDQSAARVDADGSYPCSGTPDFFPTQLVGTWVPGAGAVRTPPGTGTPIPKGGVLVVNVHYHPTGTTTEVDRSSVALAWTTEKPDHFATWFLVDLPFGSEPLPDDDGDTAFLIPPGAPHHVERHVLDTGPYLPIPLPIFAIGPHMHFLGRDMLVTVHHADGDACLVHTPTYRFDWQTTYVYDAAIEDLPTVQPGDRIEVRCTYDNSPSNPYLGKALAASHRTEPGDVGWGEQTGDEMCMAIVGLVTPPIDLDDVLAALGLAH